MDQSKELIEMLIIISGLILITLLFVKTLGKTNVTHKKSKLKLMPTKPNKSKSSKELLMDRLIDYEIKRMPHLSRKEAKRIALDRLARDNR